MSDPTIQFERVKLHEPKGKDRLCRVLFNIRIVVDGVSWHTLFQTPVDDMNEGKIVQDVFLGLATLGQTEAKQLKCNKAG